MFELTPRDRERLAQLDTLANRLRHAHALIEQFAASPKDAEQLSGTIRRTVNQLKMHFTTAGFDRLAQMCAQIEQTARRGMSHGPKARSLREAIANLNRQIELERRAVVAAAQREQQQSGG